MLRESLRVALVLLIVAGSAERTLAQAPGQVQRKIQRYALLIGVDEYGPPLNKLEYCYNDIVELQAHLVAAGFVAENITVMQDRSDLARLRPTRANIESELRLRLAMANENDVVIVAFSGHGLQIDGKSFLCPADAKLDAPESLVSIDGIYGLLEKCQAGQKLLLVDACRNEPLVRGFKSARVDELEMQVQAPPRGVLVLSSCEAGQFSAEDATLRHGVFMYYVMQGLEGAADKDVEIGGNGNGVISLDELYFFAHEKTKRHVAASHGILQRPVMRGEIVGRFELALAPNASALTALRNRSSRPEIPLPTAASGAPAPDTRSTATLDNPLLRQADIYLSQGDYENAIRAYTPIIEDTTLDSALRLKARKNRGAAYLARLGKGDIDSALIDQRTAGLPGVSMTVRAATAELKVGTATKGRIKQNQTVLVTVVNGDWLWVAAVDGSDQLQGYLRKSAVMTQPTPAPAPTVSTTQPRRTTNSNATSQPYQRNYAQTPYQRPNPSRPSRAPSIWETPEWETPAEIRRGRANGTLR